MRYKLGSLFDGSGGFPLAGSLCGIVPKWAAEIEPYPIAVTRNRFPDMRHLGDISKVNGADIEPVDIITFGSPCQDLSVAGKRAGLKHADNGDEETTRSGCEGGGKGALIQEDKSATLATNNDQYLFQPVTLEPGIAQREGGHIYEGVSGTLRANAGDNRMAVAYSEIVLDDQGGQQISVRADGKCPTLRAEMHGNIPCVLHTADLKNDMKEQYLFENHSQDTRFKGPLDVCPMLPAQLGTGGNNTPFVVEECIPCHDKATRFNGGGPTRKNDGAGNGLGVGQPGDPAPTLSTCDRHIVAYCIGNGQANQPMSEEVVGALNCMHEQQSVIVFDKEAYNSGKNATGGHYIAEGGPAPSLRTEHPPGVAIKYIVRRLTPTECARLQGFADQWGDIDKKDSFTPEEYRFWLDVRNTHTAINGRAVKEYNEAQMLTWYNKLHTDSAEYKMWGNGIALPPALYCMQGIADALGGVNE